MTAKWQHRQLRFSEETHTLEINVDQIKQLGIHYWSLDADDPELAKYEREIVSASKKIGSIITNMTAIKAIDSVALRISHKNLSRSITDGSFQVRGREPEPERQSRIDDAGNLLVESAKRL